MVSTSSPLRKLALFFHTNRNIRNPAPDHRWLLTFTGQRESLLGGGDVMHTRAVGVTAAVAALAACTGNSHRHAEPATSTPVGPAHAWPPRRVAPAQQRRL